MQLTGKIQYIFFILAEKKNQQTNYVQFLESRDSYPACDKVGCSVNTYCQ